MTTDPPMIKISGFPYDSILALERAIQRGDYDTSGWPLNTVVFVESKYNTHNLPMWYAALWDEAARESNVVSFSCIVLGIPLSVTDCYHDALTRYAPVIRRAGKVGIDVNIQLRPSDLGFVTSFAAIDTTVYCYELVYRDGRAPPHHKPYLVRYCYDDTDPYQLLLGCIDSSVDDETGKFVLHHNDVPGLGDNIHEVARTVVVEYRAGTYPNLVQTIPMGQLANYSVIGWFDKDWSFVDGRHRLISTCCVTGTRRQLEPFLAACASEEARSFLIGEPRFYPGVDRIVQPRQQPGFTWTRFSPIRMPYLTLSVVALVMALHSSSLRRYDIIEVLEWLPNMRFMTRHRKDELVARVFASIKRICRYRTGPSRSTRARVAASENKSN